MASLISIFTNCGGQSEPQGSKSDSEGSGVSGPPRSFHASARSRNSTGDQNTPGGSSGFSKGSVGGFGAHGVSPYSPASQVSSARCAVQLSRLSPRKIRMKAVAFRTLDVLLSVAILAMVAHLLLIMYFAGYSLSLSIMSLKAQNVGPPTILLMGLI